MIAMLLLLWGQLETFFLYLENLTAMLEVVKLYILASISNL